MDIAQFGAFCRQPCQLMEAAAELLPGMYPVLLLHGSDLWTMKWTSVLCPEAWRRAQVVNIFANLCWLLRGTISAPCNENRRCRRARCGIVLAAAFAGGLQSERHQSRQPRRWDEAAAASWWDKEVVVVLGYPGQQSQRRGENVPRWQDSAISILLLYSKRSGRRTKSLEPLC